ncbi:MAG: hypothetical protein GXO10_05370 [Crenarchaeota archaeon]|nr:hypothetical protein [Thermoproteota archaeon]
MREAEGEARINLYQQASRSLVRRSQMSREARDVKKIAEEYLSNLKSDGEIREIIARLEIPQHIAHLEPTCGVEETGRILYSLVDTSVERVSYGDPSSIMIRPLREVILEKIDVENPWSLASPDEDPHLALIAKYGEDRGAYVRVRSGRSVGPVRTCYITRLTGTVQLVHNVYVVEDKAELQVLSTCTSSRDAVDIYHISLTEVILGEKSKFTMIMYHNWNETTKLWSSLRVRAGPESRVVLVYVTHSPVERAYDQVVVRLSNNASATSSSIIYGRRGTYRTESISILDGREASSIIISRMLSAEKAKIESLSKIIARGEGSRGHIECLGVPLDDSSVITSIPILEAHRTDVQLSHEAAIGRFSEEEITYLTTKGLNEDEAMQLLIRGFVSIDIEEIPPTLRKVVDRIVDELVRRSAL